MMGNAVAEINREFLGQFGSKSGEGGFMIGSRTSRQGTSTRQANLYDGSACPAGQEVVQHVSTPISPAYIGAPTTKASVYCKPIPAPVPRLAPVVTGPTYTTTISPVLQTEISPQISPVFQQVQDSPGSVQAATPTMIAPGGMKAEGGSAAANDSAAMLEFMRLQSEQDAARRQSDAAAREQERREREARQAAIDAEASEVAARLEAQYQAAQSEWEKTTATPGGFMATPAVMPGREIIVSDGPPVAPLQKPGLPVPLIVAGVAAIAIGGYFYASKTRKGKRK